MMSPVMFSILLVLSTAVVFSGCVNSGSSPTGSVSRHHMLVNVPQLVWGDQDTYSDDLMVVSALRLCLDYIGDKQSKPFLAGVTAAAFDIGWDGKTMSSGADGAIYAHPGHFDPGIRNAFNAIGRNYTIVYKGNPDACWKEVVRSIDAGKPVIATEWRIDHFAIIAGYDAEKKVYLARRYAARAEAPNDYVPLAPEDVGWILTIGDKRQKVSDKTAFVDSLRIAVENAKLGDSNGVRGQGGTSGEMVYGPQAFAEHSRMIPTQLQPSQRSYDWREHVLAWRLDALSLARAYAMLYLHDHRALLGKPATSHIDAAIQKYGAMLALLQSCNITGGKPPNRIANCDIVTPPAYVMLTLGPKPIAWADKGVLTPMRQFLQEPHNRKRFAEWHLQVRNLEEDALREIEKALAERE